MNTEYVCGIICKQFIYIWFIKDIKHLLNIDGFMYFVYVDLMYRRCKLK